MSVTLPFQRAFTGPIFMTETAANSVSEVLSSCSQPGTQAFRTSASLSFL